MSFTFPSAYDSSSDISCFFKIAPSQRMQESWEPEDYDASRDLAEIELFHQDFSDRFCSDLMLSELVIDFDVEEIEDKDTKEVEEKEQVERASKLRSIFQKPPPRPKLPSGNKNCCRYIILNSIRAMDDYNLPEEFKQFYRQQRFAFTGFKVLKQHLIVNDEDSMDVVVRKRLFRQYLLVFLEEKASLYILHSKKKQNIREYLKYKNEVMMFYIRFPEIWMNNSTRQHQHQHRHQP